MKSINGKRHLSKIRIFWHKLPIYPNDRIEWKPYEYYAYFRVILIIDLIFFVQFYQPLDWLLPVTGENTKKNRWIKIALKVPKLAR